MTKVNLFVDMDGVLAEQRNDLPNYMYDKGFFLSLPPINNMIEVVKELNNEFYEVYILSTVVRNEYCEREKGQWLDRFLPEIKTSNRLFVPSGIDKSVFIQDKNIIDNAINVLIDDFTENLITWTFEGALPIKVLNGLNNTKGTWLNNGGLYIKSSDEIKDNISKIKKLIISKQMDFLKIAQ